MNSPHTDQWRGAVIFSLIYAWTNGLVDNRDIVDLSRHRAQYDVTVMGSVSWQSGALFLLWNVLLKCWHNTNIPVISRHVREQREVQELLERLAKVKAIRKEAALKAHEVRAPVKGHPHVKGDGKLRNETKPKAGRRKPRAMEGPRMADKDPSMWVVVPATLPHVSGRGVRHSDEGGRQAVHGDDDAEEVEAEPPRITINHTGSRYQELQKHIYYNQCKPGSELLSSRTEATTKAEDADVGKITPGDAPSQLSHATGYVIEGDTVNAVSGTRPGLIINGGGDQVRDAAEPRLTPQSQAIRDDVDRMYRASLTSTAGAGTPVDDEEDDLKHSDPAKDVDLFNTRLPQVIIRRFPDEGDPGDFGVSMRMALNCNQITTPIDRPSRTLSSGRRVFPSLRRDLEPKRSVIHRTQSFKTPLKPGSQASSLPLLPKTSSLVHSEPSRASERYTATRTSQDAEQTHKDLFKYKAIKRKPLKMPTLPIRLRYSKSRESNTTRSQDQKVLDALQHRKRSLRTRIDNFLSDNSSDDWQY